MDAAYDAVLQQSFSKRRTGAGVKLEVKYADVRLASPQAGKLGGGAKQAGTSSSRGGGPGGRGGGAAGGVNTEQLAQKLAASVPHVQVPEAAELTTLAALFAAAGLGTLAAGAMHVQVCVLYTARVLRLSCISDPRISNHTRARLTTRLACPWPWASGRRSTTCAPRPPPCPGQQASRRSA